MSTRRASIDGARDGSRMEVSHMVVLRKLALAGASSLLLTVVACGSSATESTSDFDQNSAGGGTLGGTGNGTGDGQNSLGTGGGGTTNDTLAGCATSSATAEARPVYLVFMFDKSGSMTKDGSPKWASSKAATKAFFESPQSKGMSASLTFFPDDGDRVSCNAGDYDTPVVPITALPSASFGSMLDAQTPDGNTPTKPALEGAIRYATDISKGQAKDGKVAIVLVTDGIPQGCSGNNVANIKKVAADVAATIPTYVIGVGDELTSLDDIAAGGGTGKALIVSVTNPAQIQADFTKAIDQIKASALACDYTIPAPPDGQSFDRAKVNVQHVTQDGGPATLAYNETCADGAGWKYDDVNAPSRVLLCNGSCDAVKAKPGKVDIVFGCATQGASVK